MKHDLRLLLPALGIWVGAFSQSLIFQISIGWHLALGALLILASWVYRGKNLSVFLGACLVGALTLAIHQSALQRDFFAERAGSVVRLTAITTSDVREIEGRIKGDFREQNRFLVEIKSKEVDGIAISVPLLLFGRNEVAALIPGQEIEILGRVRPPVGFTSFASSITQVGELKQMRKSALIWRWTSSIRSAIKESVRELPSDARALIPGLVIGDRSAQQGELSDVMRRSGLTHLTAVSGANFAIVAALLLLIGRSLRIRGRPLWLGVALCLAIFIFLVRPSSSVLRAAVMTAVLLFAKSRGVQSSAIPALAAAISFLLLINPFYVRDAGFALSVFATAGLLFLAPVITSWLESRKLHHLLAEALAIPISATIFCLPVIVMLSGELSIISILANFLVAPVIALITICGVALMVVAPINVQLGAFVGWIITPFALWITFVARSLSSLPFAALKWPKSWLGALAMLVSIILLIYMVRSQRRFLLVAVAVIFSLQIAITFPLASRSWIPQDWRIFQCDVGQGDGMIIKSGERSAIVIDVGPDAKAINRCLTLLGITHVELLVLTHFHADHVAGLTGVLSNRSIAEVWISQTIEPELEFERVTKALMGVKVQAPVVGQRYLSNGIEIQVVATAPNTSPNDSSIAVLANITGITLFAAGDLELAGQARALAILKHTSYKHLWNRTPIDVMKGIHHGSALQLPELIEYLRPRVTLFSVGAENPYGHPSTSALDLYGRFGRVYRTDQDQSIVLAKRSGNLIVVKAPVTPWAL